MMLKRDCDIPLTMQRGQPVRTKYDRMFERTNQSILTPHYSALIAHDDDDADEGQDGNDEVFTIARRNHALDDEGEDLADGDLVPTERAGPTPIISSEDLSKRKLKAASSKKQNLRNRPAPEKLVFDDEGQATNFYESGVQAEEGAGGEAARKEFFERERQQMREADKIDRAVARDAKREKKRKRKEREREVSDELDESRAMLMSRLWMRAVMMKMEGRWLFWAEQMTRRAKRKRRLYIGPPLGRSRKFSRGQWKTKRLWHCDCFRDEPMIVTVLSNHEMMHLLCPTLHSIILHPLPFQYITISSFDNRE